MHVLLQRERNMSEKNYELIRIDADSWRIQESNVRCFLFTGSDRALLVDSGCFIDDVRSIVESVTSLPVLLANTHTDFDHIHCNTQFDCAYMHPAEYAFYHQNQGGSHAVKPLWDGDVIDLGGRRFEVVETPGHTPGSIAFLDRDRRILVGGDGVQDWRIFMFGPGRDLLAYQYSMEKLQRLSDAFDTVYPSHGSFSVASSILPGLIAGARSILEGNCPFERTHYLETPILEYDMGVAHMLMPQP